MLIPASLDGTMPAYLAAQRGHGMLAECLHAAVARAVSRAFPMFRDLRSQLVLFNRVPGGLPQQYLPRDAVGRIFEYCATPDCCWFAAVSAAGGNAAAAATQTPILAMRPVAQAL